MQFYIKTKRNYYRTNINIAFVLPTLSLEGPGIVLHSLIRNLDRLRYNIFVCTLIRTPKIKKHASIKKDLIEAGVKIFEFHLIKPFDIASILLLRNIYKKYQIHIVHTHLIRGHIYGRIAARLAKVPITVSTVHGMDYWKKSKKLYHRIATLIDKWTIPFANKIITVSDAVKEFIKETQGISSNKILTIYNGVDLKKYSKNFDVCEKKKEINLNPDDPVIGVISRLDKRKGIGDFLKTAAMILEERQNVQFLIVGDGLLKKRLQDLTCELDINEKVIFAGFHTDIPEILSCLDILVMPSISEGFGLPLIEAMAMAKPVIATNIGPVKELVNNNETGLIVPAQDTFALYKAILTLLNSEKMREKMGLKGQKLVEEKFSSVRMAKNYDKLYCILLDKKLIEFNKRV